MDKLAKDIAQKIGFEADTGVVLGSGLGDWVSRLEIIKRVHYSEMDGFPVSTVDGHSGSLVYGKLGNKKIIVMQGRVHFYEGYSMNLVTLPIRVLHHCGVKTIILTNSAGGLSFTKGDIMLISDHINLTGTNPLIGKNETGFERFPDMTFVYDAKLRDRILRFAKKERIKLKEGVFIQVHGPSYETPAEVRMLRALGGDAVAMSTACEAITARHCGMRVVGLSNITNDAAGLSNEVLSHSDIISASKQSHENIWRLLDELVSCE